MKTLIATYTLVAAALCLPAQAAKSYQIIAADERIESAFCAASANLTLLKFSQFVKQEGYNIRQLARHLNCNQLPLAVFAKRYNHRTNVGDRIAALSNSETKNQASIEKHLVVAQTITVHGS